MLIVLRKILYQIFNIKNTLKSSEIVSFVIRKSRDRIYE